jgi:TorA maturation chaperone TorD
LGSRFLPETGIAEEERLRAQTWRLLGRLLRAPPDAETLHAISNVDGDDSPLGRGFADLAASGRAADLAQAAAEYGALFIGLTHGELIPYGSYYLTGFLHEKPLARLRGDMARLGIALVAGVSEPEDHMAALCEMMAGLIEGEFGPVPLAEQEGFFADHIAAWADRFFADLETAPSAVLYRRVGTIGRLFVDIERQGFAMAA